MIRTCANCQQEFDIGDRASPTATDGTIAQISYCSMKCKRAANNRTYYRKNRQEIIRKATEYKKRKKMNKPRKRASYYAVSAYGEMDDWNRHGQSFRRFQWLLLAGPCASRDEAAKEAEKKITIDKHGETLRVNLNIVPKSKLRSFYINPDKLLNATED